VGTINAKGQKIVITAPQTATMDKFLTLVVGMGTVITVKRVTRVKQTVENVVETKNANPNSRKTVRTVKTVNARRVIFAKKEGVKTTVKTASVMKTKEKTVKIVPKTVEIARGTPAQTINAMKERIVLTVHKTADNVPIVVTETAIRGKTA
jgi:hypothetical protein